MTLLDGADKFEQSKTGRKALEISKEHNIFRFFRTAGRFLELVFRIGAFLIIEFQKPDFCTANAGNGVNILLVCIKTEIL